MCRIPSFHRNMPVFNVVLKAFFNRPSTSLCKYDLLAEVVQLRLVGIYQCLAGVNMFMQCKWKGTDDNWDHANGCIARWHMHIMKRSEQKHKHFPHFVWGGIRFLDKQWVTCQTNKPLKQYSSLPVTLLYFGHLHGIIRMQM